jgi:Protein kinase domain
VTLPSALDDVLDRMADGAHVDWEAVQQRANSPEQSAMLRNLRILARLGDTHRDQPVEPATDERVVSYSPPAAETTAGDVITQWGRYRLIRAIGQGSFGTVYLARDEQLDREVALKLMRRGLVAREDVKSEGRALARVDHPNVLTVYGVEEHGGRLALCMKYVRGRTLEDIIRTDGPLNADEAAVVGKAMCNAVAAVHAAGVLHRDIKARNVMRERNGRYILMDFGAGVMQGTDGSSSRETTIGTPLYMAPELFNGHAASRVTDVYAIGVLLYFLVSGEHPVSGRSIDDIKAAHRARQRTQLDERRLDLPSDYVRAVDSAIADDPAQRPESASALLRMLEHRDESQRADAGERLPALLRRIAVGLGVAIVLPAYSGLIAQYTFNHVLDRPGAFDPMSMWDTWRLGLEAMVLPTVTVAVLGAIVAAVQAGLTLFPGIRSAWNGMWARAARATGLVELEFARAITGLALLASCVGFAIVWVLWNDVLYAFLKSVTADDLTMFEPFTPARGTRSLGFRMALPLIFFTAAMLWSKAAKVGKVYGVAMPTASKTAAIVAAAVLLAFEHAPYKLMTERNNRMPVVIVEGQACYQLGEKDAELRVYCPLWTAPRVRSVPASAVSRRCGVDANMFLPSAPRDCQSVSSE